MYIRVTRTSAALVLFTAASCGLAPNQLSAQEGMRPVPRFSGTSIRDQRTDAQKAASASKLQWRTSREVAPAAPVVNSVSEATPILQPISSLNQAEPRTQVARVSTQATGSEQTVAPVLQARYQNSAPVPGDAGGLQLPPGLRPESAPTVAPEMEPAEDFFLNPFGDEAPAPGAAPALEPPKAVVPPVQNGLRSPGLPQPLTLPGTPDEDVATEEPMDATESAPAESAPEEPAVEEPATDDMNVEEQDLPLPTRDPRPLRSNEEEPRAAAEEENPFDRNRSLGMRDDDVSLRRPVEFSCDKFRKSISEATIQTVSLDISPPFRPDVIEVDEFEKLKNKFDEAQEVRDWQSIDGRKLGRGRLKDLAYEKVVIETEFGTMEELPINRISEADLAYLSKNWGLPQECLIEQVAYQERSWTHSKVTWKASNLCHKPLYFEDVNLERYGHDAGPFAQPIISSAHFFANIAVLPYKMGVHAPSECQYTLGYYRPGNCAPWIVPPVPLSLRGGLYQAAAMTGAFWLIP